jgi:hypothetical protein
LNSSRDKLLPLKKRASGHTIDALLLHYNHPSAVFSGNLVRQWRKKIPAHLQLYALMTKAEIELITSNAEFRSYFLKSIQEPDSFLEFVTFMYDKGFFKKATYKALTVFTQSNSVRVDRPNYTGPSIAQQILGRSATREDVVKAMRAAGYEVKGK